MIERSARLVTGAASLSEPPVRSAMMIKVRVISDSKELRDIRDLWDRFVEMQADNPNLLSAFVERSIEVGRSDGWTPLLLMILADEVVVGLAPLMTKRKFGIRYARFVTSAYFVASEGYREICVSRTLDYLFRALRCHFVRLTLPATSCCTTVLNMNVMRREFTCPKMKVWASALLLCKVRGMNSLGLGGSIFCGTSEERSVISVAWADGGVCVSKGLIDQKGFLNR